MLKEVRFRFHHDGCWLQDTTTAHPDVTLVATSVYLAGDDVVVGLTAHGPAQAVAAAHADWRANKRIHKVTKLHEGPRGTRFHVAYAKAGSIYPNLIEHTPVSLGPIRIARGVEYYQIIGESPDVSEIVRSLGKHGNVEVESIREADVDDPPGDSVWDRLTDKQVEAVLLAHREGYYAWPRRHSATDLAQQLGLSSSAFLDHLRTAEAKLIDQQVQELRSKQPERT